MTIETTIERDGVELEVTCEFYYIPASRGSRDRYGCPIEPDEPADVEFIAATLENGVEIELTQGEIKDAEQKALEQVEPESCCED